MAKTTVTIDPGAGGDDVAIDKISGADYQYVKLADGTPDSTAHITGDTSNGLDVDVTRVQGTVTVDSELATKDLDSGAGTDTQAVVGLVIAKSGGAANVSATDPLPVVVGSTTPVQIQGGANQIGKLAANSGVDIGDVDVTSSALPTGAATSAKQPALGTAGAASADVISVQGVASMTALKVDGSAVTQPVSGTVTASGPLTDTQLRASAVPVSLASAPSTAVTNAGTFAVQIAANSSVNQAQIAGTTTDTNSGTKSAGTQRVVIATDQPALTNALKVDGSAVTQPVSLAGTQSVNQAQVAGTATSVNSGTKDAGTQRVILASDQTVVPVSDNAGSLTVDAPLATPVFTTPTPSTTGGWSKSAFAALTNTKTLVKNAAGTFGGYLTVYNPNATVAYVQIFDVAATASVTLGTTVADARIVVPATSAANMEVTNGVNMANGIVIACTTTATGSTAPGTGLDGTILYK